MAMPTAPKYRFAQPVFLAATLLLSLVCRTPDRAVAICEENNRNCHRGCSTNSIHFAHSKMASQSISQCDVRCDDNYQACLKRQQNKNVPVVDNP